MIVDDTIIKAGDYTGFYRFVLLYKFCLCQGIHRSCILGPTSEYQHASPAIEGGAICSTLFLVGDMKD